MQELLSLSRSELVELAAAIRSGRLSPPYSATAVARFISEQNVSSAVQSLQAMVGLGMNLNASASVLDLVAATLTSRSALDELVDVVITGPASQGAGRNTSVVVSQLFRQARKSVTLIGYAVSGGREVFRALADRMDQLADLQVHMYLDIQRVAGDTSTDSEIVRRFMANFLKTQWPEHSRKPQVFYDPRALAMNRADRAALHAKCVIVDELEVFVSSANFTPYAQERNIEIGLCLRSRQVARRITDYLAEIVESGHIRPAFSPTSQSSR
jgi:phosphatidylserine/phosphatidylglycerophosphate/cardiolipin synthase-like enzyme